MPVVRLNYSKAIMMKVSVFVMCVWGIFAFAQWAWLMCLQVKDYITLNLYIVLWHQASIVGNLRIICCKYSIRGQRPVYDDERIVCWV